MKERGNVLLSWKEYILRRGVYDHVRKRRGFKIKKVI